MALAAEYEGAAAAFAEQQVHVKGAWLEQHEGRRDEVRARVEATADAHLALMTKEVKVCERVVIASAGAVLFLLLACAHTTTRASHALHCIDRCIRYVLMPTICLRVSMKRVRCAALRCTG